MISEISELKDTLRA